jgi:hypothetical protein
VDLAEGDRSPWLEDLQPGLETAAHAIALGKALLATLPARLVGELRCAASDLTNRGR